MLASERRSKRLLLLAGIMAISSTVAHCEPFSAGSGSGSSGAPTGDAASAGDDGGVDGAKPPPSCPEATDYNSDARNCGLCGRDCGKGTCTNKMCSAYDLNEAGTGGVGPWNVAVDDKDVYWTSHKDRGGDGWVRAVSKAGGNVRIVANAPDSFDVIPINNTSAEVFFTAVLNPTAINNGIFSTKGGVITPIVSSVYGINLAAQGNVVFASVNGSGVERGLYKIDVNNPTNPVHIPTNSEADEGIAVDAQSIFVANHLPNTGTIERMGLNGENETSIATALRDPRRLTIDATTVYWTSSFADDGVMRCSKSGSPPDRLLTAQVRFGVIINDDKYVYVAAELENKIIRVNKANKEDIVTMATVTGPIGLAQDADALYFSEPSTGAIKRVTK